MGRTYAAEKNAAIFFKIAVSDSNVSSKPGVSTNVTILPDSSKVFEIWMADVQDFSPRLTAKFEPLSRLMNYATMNGKDCRSNGVNSPTVDFPDPVAPMTLYGLVR